MISIDSPPAGGELCEAYGKRKRRSTSVLRRKLQIGDILLDLCGSAGFLQVVDDLLGVFLGDGFLQGLRAVVDDLLGFLQAQAGQSADDLDDSDLVRRRQSFRTTSNSVFSSAASAAAGSGSSNSSSSSGNAEGLFQSMNQLSQLENGQALNFFDQSSDFFRHCKILRNCVIRLMMD